MSDFCHGLYSSVAGTTGHSAFNSDVNASLVMSLPMALNSSMHSSFPSVGYFQGFYEPVVLSDARPHKSRRKSAPGLGTSSDRKHRRTRSGCFMCRSRRVKCDETRPICERCRKGGRECVYPEPHTSRHSLNQMIKPKDTKTHASSSSSIQGDEDEVEHDWKLESIRSREVSEDLSRRGSLSWDGRRLSAISFNTQSSFDPQPSETPCPDDKNTTSPAFDLKADNWFTNADQTSALLLTLAGRLDWPHLPLDIQHHLSFFVNNITHHHYSLPIDEDGFFSTILPNLAIQCEPLLNALVAFSTYHATLQQPDGQLEEFLQFYNRSVTQLLSILKGEETHTVHVLVTMLQLATIEEYLGDRANSIGHQKAAFEIITQIFTPETVTQSPISRMCLNWCARFDNTATLLCGLPAEIPRQWLVSMGEFYRSQVVAYPEVMRWKIEERYAGLRLVSYDMSVLYCRNGSGQMTPSEYNMEHERISIQLEDWKNTWDATISDPASQLASYSWKQTLDPADFDIDCPPSAILHGDSLNENAIMMAVWHSIMMKHHSYSLNLPIEELSRELSRHAHAVCQNFSLMEQWPSAPAGVLIAMQPSIFMAALFSPRHPVTDLWLKRKFALLESMGHIHPRNRRVEMAEVFRDDACTKWWLPNDEGLTPVLQTIRNFADERNTEAKTGDKC